MKTVYINVYFINCIKIYNSKIFIKFSKIVSLVFIESDSLLETVESDLRCEGLHHYTSHPDYITIYPDNGKCPPKGK